MSSTTTIQRGLQGEGGAGGLKGDRHRAAQSGLHWGDHLYLVAVMEWATRRVFAWPLPNTLGARFCTEALTEALERYGRPQIFNTDHGSQFTSRHFTDNLKDGGVAIFMDGGGRCMDNIFIERLWRPLKYEAV